MQQKTKQNKTQPESASYSPSLKTNPQGPAFPWVLMEKWGKVSPSRTQTWPKGNNSAFKALTQAVALSCLVRDVGRHAGRMNKGLSWYLLQ